MSTDLLPEPDDLQLTQFLLAMAESLPPPIQPPSLGQSLQTTLEEHQFCTTNGIRCICGISFAFPGEEMVLCPKCSRYLHRNCLSLPEHFDLRVFACPFCQFRFQNIDPLKQLTSWLESVSNTVGTIGRQFEYARHIFGQMRAKDVESARLDAYQSFYRMEVLDSRNAQDIVNLGRGYGELSEKLVTLESSLV